MKLFLDYLNKIKLQILLMLFPTILTGMIFLLYQLPLEPILYIAVLWILTGLGTCAFGFHNYQKNIHNLQIISAAPDINLSRMDAPSNEADALQQEIMHSLNRMRIDAETANQKTLEEMAADGTMAKISEKWFDVGSPDQDTNFCSASAPSGKSDSE